MQLKTRFTDLVGIQYPIGQGGMMWAGQIQGLIHDIPSCADLIQRIMDEAIDIIQARLQGFISEG